MDEAWLGLHRLEVGLVVHGGGMRLARDDPGSRIGLVEGWSLLVGFHPILLSTIFATPILVALFKYQVGVWVGGSPALRFLRVEVHLMLNICHFWIYVEVFMRNDTAVVSVELLCPRNHSYVARG